MRVYSYIVRYDFGFAPNPFHGWCTLATCKQDMRPHVTIGDWVVGTGSKGHDLAGHLIYAMQVQEILTYDAYWNDPRFQVKKPNPRGSLKQRYGDNIYHKDAKGNWIQENSRHSLEGGLPNPEHVERDTKADAVLASQRFFYYGRRAPTIPKTFRDWEGRDVCQDRPAFRCNFPDEMRDAFVEWLEEGDGGYLGVPNDW